MENLRFERLELGAGVDAELLDQKLAPDAVGSKRVSLTPGSIEGEHEERRRRSRYGWAATSGSSSATEPVASFP